MAEQLDRLKTALADRYTIERELGSGGMSVVYLAEDPRHHRKVAIKVLRSELAESVGVERFVREIRIEASFQHPNIVPLYDSGDAGGLPYYVMPYVEGESLKDHLARDIQLTLEEALKITREVAAGLTYAHHRGVVHRDIKPENILLTADRVMIADFGIARVTAEVGGEHLTTTGVAVGTPQYMSPEQASGDGKVDARTDLYALATLLYEMLAGEPPFTGPTRSAIIARIISERVPSLAVVRPNVPSGVEQVVTTALAKVPADRFSSVAEMIEALDRAADTAPARRPRRDRSIASRLMLAAVLAAAAFGVWNVAGRTPPLDANRIVVFPLMETGIGNLSEGIGEVVALGIGSALEQTAPLRWEDGWLSLDQEQRANPRGVTTEEKDEIARVNRARYRLDGSIVGAGDAISVILWLYDVDTESVLRRKTVTGVSSDASAMQLAISGIRELLPVLLRPGSDVERIPLEDRELAAVVLWMQGQREYRSSRFQSALTFFERALERDSALAMAALNAAQSASWLGRLRRAEVLVSVALSSESFLATPQAHFAHGFRGYLTGAADTAVEWLERALEHDDEWAGAHMALGEVFYHLLPSGRYPLDSLAEAEFRAAAADSNFSPPLFHLAEIAIRRGDHDRGGALIDRYREFAPEGTIIKQLTFMLECVGAGAEGMDWDAAVRVAPLDALLAAKSLAVGGSNIECAEGGFSAVMRDTAATDLHWGATLGLQSVLLAAGRHDDFVQLIDSVITYRPATMTLYLLGAIADSQLTSKAVEVEAFIKLAFGPSYESIPSAQLRWTMGVWHTHRGDEQLVRALRDALAAQADDRQAGLFAASLSGQLALLRGDSAGAVEILGGLASAARRDSIEWQPGESLPSERLMVANLLFEAGRYDEAIQVASAFDHAGPVIFPAYLPASLSLRYRAAQAGGRRRLVARYRERLLNMDRADLIAGLDRQPVVGSSR